MADNTRGTARGLPKGRLASFEDVEDAPGLATLLSRRTTASEAAAEPTSAVDPESLTDEKPASERGTDVARVGTSPDGGEDVPAAPARTRSRKVSQQRQGSERPDTPTQRAQNHVRPTAVQIPVGLIDRIVEHRTRSGRSNGDIVRDALEATYPRLGELLSANTPAPQGRSLFPFPARASRSVRMMDGPLTPLNLRLLEDDFRIIDNLVEEFNAFSRGHLITVALNDYLSPAEGGG